MRTVFWAGLAAFLGDQLSKYIVIHMVDLSRIRAIDVLPPIPPPPLPLNVNHPFAPDGPAWSMPSNRTSHAGNSGL